MLVEIITPDAKLFEGEVNSIKLPGTNGGFEILINHAPIISTLTAGTISIASDNGQKESFEIQGGVIEMQNNKIIVLAEFDWIKTKITQRTATTNSHAEWFCQRFLQSLPGTVVLLALQLQAAE